VCPLFLSGERGSSRYEWLELLRAYHKFSKVSVLSHVYLLRIKSTAEQYLCYTTCAMLRGKLYEEEEDTCVSAYEEATCAMHKATVEQTFENVCRGAAYVDGRTNIPFHVVSTSARDVGAGG